MPPHHGRAVRSHRRPPHQWRSRNLRLSLLLAASLVFWAPSGPAAREIATRVPAARSGRCRSPPVPSGPSGALRTSGAWCAGMWLGASFRSPARPRHCPPERPCPPAPSTAGCCRSPVRPATHVKPSSPLLACAPSPVKPTTPLQARYTCFWRYFIEQRRRGFHTGVLRLPHWC